MIISNKKATLILANGMEFSGYSVGAKGTVIGEIVFSTSMTGYQETLTDPSYYGQIVTQTFPLIGNYGTNSFDKESDKCYLSGYIIREWCKLPSNFRCEDNLSTFLEEQNVIGIYGIDTRELTKIIRESGVINGAITTEQNFNKEDILKKIRDFRIIDAVKSVSCTENKDFKSKESKRKVCLFDFGYKYNIREELLKRGCDVTVVPYDTKVCDIEKMNVDGIMLSNGPGDPAENVEVIENLKDIINLDIPIFGICLGHQLMALANGAKTKKLLYGHRGANQPVIDIDLDRTFVTTQNHGYEVLADTICDKLGYVSHKNANDGSCEGIRYKKIKAFTVQFHPEACGGPKDTSYLFDEFIKLIDGEEK